MILGSCTAYGLSRFNYRFGFMRNSDISFFFLSQLILPPVVLALPFLVLYKELDLLDTRIGLIGLYTLTVLPIVIWIMRDQFGLIPVELEEAARIDGCSKLGEWWNVMIPAAKADLITLAMFVFIGTWSDFLWPLVILDDPGLFTLPLGLQQLASSFSLDWRIVAAGSVVSILPVLVMFVLLQRFILPNASGDAVKG